MTVKYKFTNITEATLESEPCAFYCKFVKFGGGFKLINNTYFEDGFVFVKKDLLELAEMFKTLGETL